MEDEFRQSGAHGAVPDREDDIRASLSNIRASLCEQRGLQVSGASLLHQQLHPTPAEFVAEFIMLKISLFFGLLPSDVRFSFSF